MMKPFVKIVNGSKPLTISAKSFILAPNNAVFSTLPFHESFNIRTIKCNFSYQLPFTTDNHILILAKHLIFSKLSASICAKFKCQSQLVFFHLIFLNATSYNFQTIPIVFKEFKWSHIQRYSNQFKFKSKFKTMKLPICSKIWI